MTDFTLNLVDAIISGRATDIETAFQEAITDKISIVMDTRRTEIAQSMFTKESVEEEEFALEDYSVEELEDFMMSEDFEQLDELSKATLGSYVNKSRHDLYNKQIQYRNTGDMPERKKLQDKATKRGSSISKAVDKMTKEEFTLEDYSVEELEDFMMSEDFEQLDEEEQEILFELSQGLKDRYIKAATASKNSSTKLQKQYKASSDKHFGIANDHATKQLNLAAGLKKTNNSFDKRANVAHKVKGHSTQQTHHQMLADYSSRIARRHDDVAKKREAGLKRANPNPKPSFLQRVKNKIGLGEELYLEDYSVEELEDFMVSEDFEQLDEVSKATLGSYVKKASGKLTKEEFELEEAVTASQLIANHNSSDHGGAQHFSNVDGKHHSWNYVKKNKEGTKYEVTPDKGEAEGIAHKGKFLKMPK